jgi:hypothetical protein
MRAACIALGILSGSAAAAAPSLEFLFPRRHDGSASAEAFFE